MSGPSGAGKTSLCKEVLKRFSWLRAAVSHTTRPPRPGEEDGKDYFFVDPETFDRMIREEAFLEWAEVHGHRYGTSVENLQGGDRRQSLLFEVDVAYPREVLWWMLGWGADAEVLEPGWLREEAKSEVGKMMKRYDNIK